MRTHPIFATATATALLAVLACPLWAAAPTPDGMALIPAGEFEMGDHHGFVDPKHGGDETPVHTVRLDAYHIGINNITTREYCEFLNASLAAKQIEVRDGGIYLTGGKDLLCETRAMSPHSRIGWNAGKFSVLDQKELHPIVCIRWAGAAAYCNWLGSKQGKPLCYNPATWDCDFNKSGYRLPTEAEWEYAARGGLKNPYRNFPCGDEADATKANWPESKNPFRTGPLPWTTPAGFFNGKLQRKTDFAWPGTQETYQTSDAKNGYGLYDMTGNVWQFINDWYGRDYYSYSPKDNPPGPAAGSMMPDGKPYRGMRGGNWYNGENGHGRVSNRNPSYFRGPQDPNHPYYHLGFRVALPVNAESRPTIKPTPVQQSRGRDGGPPPRPRRENSGEPGTQLPPPANGANGDNRSGRGFGNSPVSEAIDRNGDGTLSADEITAAPASLRTLDKNKDGSVTADEIGAPGTRGQSAADGRSRSPAGPLMRFIDSNRDGDLTAAEINAASAALRAADSNADGKIEREEAVGRGGTNGGAPRPQSGVDSPPPPRGDGIREVPSQPNDTTPTRSADPSIRKPIASFVLRSSAAADGGTLPAEFTGDGAAATLPLEWTGAPEGTKSYAIIMHHEAPDTTKWYWILYNIPAETRGLAKNTKGVGTLGNNCVTRRQEYAPPHSKGPGAKTYIYTVYALSAPVQISTPPAAVDRTTLLAAMKDKVLATAELRVTYTRPEGTTEPGGREDRGERREPPRDRQPGRPEPENR